MKLIGVRVYSTDELNINGKYFGVTDFTSVHNGVYINWGVSNHIGNEGDSYYTISTIGWRYGEDFNNLCESAPSITTVEYTHTGGGTQSVNVYVDSMFLGYIRKDTYTGTIGIYDGNYERTRSDDVVKLIPYMCKKDGNNEMFGVMLVSRRKSGDTNWYAGDCTFIYKYNGIWYGTEPDYKEPKDLSSDNVDDDGKTQGGISEGGHDGGTNIGLPTLPDFNFSDIGYNLYVLDRNGVSDLMEYLWSDDFITNIKKLYNDPIESIVSLNLADYSPVTYGTSPVIIGNTQSPVSGDYVNQFAHLSCGSVDIKEYYGSYCDYAPFVSARLYLPKVGFIPIELDDIMHNRIYVDYNIENSSGQGLCIVRLENKRTGNITIYDTFPCQCSVRLPLSAKDSSERYTAFMNSCANIIGSSVIGGGTATISSTISAVENVAMSKNHYANLGGIGDFGALMSHKKPYVILTYHDIIKPSQYNKYVGYKNPVRVNLSSKSGYTVIEETYITFECPNKVKERIKTKLKNGVIV